ncbi:MAG TPA: hypothetical protein VFF13_03765 [archaeon]|nr:hypothetical protein [archaeon]
MRHFVSRNGSTSNGKLHFTSPTYAGEPHNLYVEHKKRLDFLRDHYPQKIVSSLQGSAKKIFNVKQILYDAREKIDASEFDAINHEIDKGLSDIDSVVHHLHENVTTPENNRHEPDIIEAMVSDLNIELTGLSKEVLRALSNRKLK